MTTRRKSIQVIRDPLLEPFFITRDEYSFTIKQVIESDSDHFRSKGKSKTYEKSLYYYSNFGPAINKIAELKSNLEDYNTLKEYIDNYQTISNQIKNYTDEIRSTI